MTAVNQSGSAPEAERPSALRDWRGSTWIAALTVALLSTSQWLSATSVGYLVLGATATLGAAWLALGLQRRIRRWSLAASALLAIALVIGARSQVTLGRIERNWPSVAEHMRAESLDRLNEAVVLAAAALENVAEKATQIPAPHADAFAQLRAIAGSASREVVLYRGDSAIAWAGRPRVGTDGLTQTVGVVGAPFYLSLYAVRRSAGMRAVASELLFAAPPADRMAQTLAGRVAREAGIASFRFAPISDSGALGVARVIRAHSQALFAVDAVLPSVGEVRLVELERARTRAGLLLALGLAGYVVASWRLRRSVWWRAGVVGAGVTCVAAAPLSAYSNVSLLFDPAIYYTPLGGPLTANAAALGLTAALTLLMLFSLVRRQARVADRRLAATIVVLIAGLGPFLLRDLARGIQIPSYGVSASLWLIWQVPLFLAAVAVMLAGAAAGSAAMGGSRGLPPIVAPALASVSALLAPIVWDVPGQWPWWYTALWILAVASLALSRRTAVVASAATVAAFGAMTLVWGGTTRARVRLAEQDVATLGTGDPYARELARRLGDRMTGASPLDRRALLERYATSELAAAGYPVWMAAWRTGNLPTASLSTAPIPVSADSLRAAVTSVRVRRAPMQVDWRVSPAVAHSIAVPTDSGVVTIVVAPRSRLIVPDPFSRLLGLDVPAELEPPYSVSVAPAPATAVPGVPTRSSWRREGDELHGDWVAASGSGVARAHVEVALRPLESLVQRGALIALLDLAVVGLLWLTSVLADGVAARWLAGQGRLWSRSYRIRLTLALFAFFMVPAIAFAIWSYRQLSTDASRGRELLVRETLRSVTPAGKGTGWLQQESRRVGSPLFLYEGGELVAASDSLMEDLAPIGRRLDASVAEALLVHGEAGAYRAERLAGPPSMLFGYRALELRAGSTAVLAAPARVDDVALEQRGRDLGVLVLFATAIGALAALWLSGMAARELARPIGSLRRAALALASGERDPALADEPTTEFFPVFAAFRRMMSDLSASRSALEEAQRRTATVLRNAASGVIAVDDDGVVTLANPRADQLIGAALTPGTRLSDRPPPELAAIVGRFLSGGSDDEAFEMRHGEQQWRGRLTRLARGGAVVTVDDVSEIARAERVLAWGEMARQVAHEIKNPLTPIRLGVQHLRRARADARVDFDAVLEQNVERILREIDRLDEIARAFSRYGQPPEQRAGAEPTDVAAVLRDLVALETMGADTVRWSLHGADDEVRAMARREELREVLLNVLENSRLARAGDVRCSLVRSKGNVEILVRDTGQGIAPEVLPRIFEPHFSTRTSGSGLGLAVSRRLIESWGGAIEITSVVGKGTDVLIRLQSG